MSRLRIVLDTNVLISAALKPSGQQAQVMELMAFREIGLFISEAVMAEYREVFSRTKFSHLDPKNVSRLLDLIEAEATMVTPTGQLAIAKHDSDNRLRMRRSRHGRLHCHRQQKALHQTPQEH